jgi:nitrite reductase/ring-hydroxylating ferredoxin subunit
LKQQTLCKRTELNPGQMRQFQIGRRGILLVRDESGDFYAVGSECAHQSAPLVNGKVERMWVGDEVGTSRPDDERTVVVCPWHNYEFDVATGRSPCDPDRLLIQTYRVELDGEDVVVSF